MSNLKFGLVGQYQSGKSLLINCLLQQPIATVGVGNATTHTMVNYIYSENEYVEIVDANDVSKRLPLEDLKGIDTDGTIRIINVYLNNLFLKKFSLIDMPGMGYDDGDNEAALEAIQNIDFAIVVVSNDKSLGVDSSAYKDFCLLRKYNIPYYLVVNCRDYVTLNGIKWLPFDEVNETIAQTNLDLIEFYPPMSYPFRGKVPIVNFMWYWYAIRGKNDEIINRKEIKTAILNCDVLNDERIGKDELIEISNFHFVEKIFNMDNRVYLELKKEFKEELQKLKNEMCPVGTIQTFAFDCVPEGWMVCDGKLLTPGAFPKLFIAIGTTFGGNGNETFALPDLRGRFVRGWDSESAERDFGSYQEDAMQEHSHDFDIQKMNISQGGSHRHPLYCNEYDTVYSVSGLASSDKAPRMCYPTQTLDKDKTDLSSTSGMHDHAITSVGTPVGLPVGLDKSSIYVSNETRPKNIALLYCIKVK